MNKASSLIFRYLLIKNNDQGWTFWDTIGLIVILFLLTLGCGIPPLLARIQRKNDVKMYVIGMNSQQIEYFNKNDTFANSLSQLNINLPGNTKTKNYTFTIKTTNKAAFSYAIPHHLNENSLNINHQNTQNMYSYVGGVFLMPNSTSSKATSIAIICKNNTPGNIKPKDPIFQQGIMSCGAGTTELGKYL